MGKGRIVSVGPGAGQYDLDAVRDVTRIDARIAFLTARIAALQTSILTAGTDEAAKLAAMQAAKAALADAIAGHNAVPSTVTAEELQKVQKAHIEALGAHKAAASALAKLRLEKTSLEKEKARLQAIPEKVRHTGAWCVDYTLDLAAGQEVGTLEINGEDDRILIVPGGKPHTAAMGKLQPVYGAPDSAAAWNWAMLPGWQKWKPTYRIGTIASIDYEMNTCQVSLDEAKSAAQGLSINQSPTLSNVPIEYMFFHASVFLVGDHIVVEFQGQDWNNPKVIGFFHDPRGDIGNLLVMNGTETPSLKHYRLTPDAVPELIKSYAIPAASAMNIYNDVQWSSRYSKAMIVNRNQYDKVTVMDQLGAVSFTKDLEGGSYYDNPRFRGKTQYPELHCIGEALRAEVLDANLDHFSAYTEPNTWLMLPSGEMFKVTSAMLAECTDFPSYIPGAYSTNRGVSLLDIVPVGDDKIAWAVSDSILCNHHIVTWHIINYTVCEIRIAPITNPSNYTILHRAGICNPVGGFFEGETPEVGWSNGRITHIAYLPGEDIFCFYREAIKYTDAVWFEPPGWWIVQGDTHTSLPAKIVVLDGEGGNLYEMEPDAGFTTLTTIP